jgi:hypothetical protein
MKVEVVTSYRVFSSSYIDLPIENVREIKDYFVIDNVLHYALKDEKWEKVTLSEKGEEEYEKSSEVKFYGAETHQTVMKLAKSL